MCPVTFVLLNAHHKLPRSICKFDVPGVRWEKTTGVMSLQVACEMSEIKTEIRYVGYHMARMELHGGCVPHDKVHTREMHTKLK